ncbi:MAG: hypothetical protein JJT96_07145 [Opitutales bacterium]|nr:hypothetical protein [Opitutales bacterium]
MQISLDPPANGETAAATTASIQRALDTYHRQGGGTVTLQAGRYLSGSLTMPSGVTLHLAHGSRLVAADDPTLFPALADHDEKLTANARSGALLQARGAEDIAITGSGTLDGGGEWDAAPDWQTAQGIFRPAVSYFENCRDVDFTGIRIVGSKWWTLHLRRCDGVRIRGVRIRSNWPNSDGIDPDGCRNVIISDCDLLCGDDCIVAKSTQGDPCENIVVTNCILETEKACFKLGTESRGPFRNIAISNCVMRGDVCFSLYMKDGGIMENITGSHLIMDTTAPFPILIDAMPRDYRSGLPAGTIRNVQLSHCVVRGNGRVWLEGSADAPLENIRLSTIDWSMDEPLPENPLPKPLGSARVILDPARPAYEREPTQVIAVNVRGLRLEGWSLTGCGATRPLLSEA